MKNIMEHTAGIPVRCLTKQEAEVMAAIKELYLTAESLNHYAQLGGTSTDHIQIIANKIHSLAARLVAG